ncbi:hypothetical protein Q5O24_04460 [Eubacteriaceae bacterium ES3]|nr:hypothetical protein Q5O24_04460 [Eubacteriaceae bacterium ES3]
MRLTKEEYLKEEKKMEPAKNVSSEQDDQPIKTAEEAQHSKEVKLIKKPVLSLDQKLSDAEIKKRLYLMTDEIVSQLSIPGKTLDELENTYVMFNGQMSVINRCRLLSFAEQQELNAKVFAVYYQKKAELK